MSRDRYESSALDYELESDPLTNNLYAFAGGNPVGNVEWDGHYYTGSDCHDNGLPGPSEFDRHCKGKKHHASGGMEVLNLFPPAKITCAGKVIKAVDDAWDVGRGAKARRATTLSQEVERLAESHITDGGTTVLGHFPGYIEKAQSRGASYFDIGAKWGQLTPVERTAAHEHFLEKIAANRDRILLSTRKQDILRGSALAHEVEYLIKKKDYGWVSQWSLRPR